MQTVHKIYEIEFILDHMASHSVLTFYIEGDLLAAEENFPEIVKNVLLEKYGKYPKELALQIMAVAQKMEKIPEPDDYEEIETDQGIAAVFCNTVFLVKSEVNQ